MSKKIYIGIAIVLGIFVLALLGYYFILSSNEAKVNGKPLTFKSFFPFGGDTTLPGDNTTSTTTPDDTGTTPINTQDFEKKLRQISVEPVSGAIVFDTKTGSIVRHIERATGHIFETELFSSNQNRISNTTIPLVYDATWTTNGTSLVAQYLKENNQTIDTYSLTLSNSTSTENKISGIPFPQNIGTYSIFGANVFYGISSSVGSSGVISGLDGSKKKEIWNSPIREILSQFVNAGTVAITTKPQEGVNGFLYFVNTTNGQSRNILRNIPGLTTLVSSDAKQVLYQKSDGGVTFYVKNLDKGTLKVLTPATFPEKCVWSKKDSGVVYCAVPEDAVSGATLTSWYMGAVAFTDDIWKYNLTDGTAQIIERLTSDSGKSIDVVKPLMSDTDHYLVFINKRDGTLWSLDLTK